MGGGGCMASSICTHLEYFYYNFIKGTVLQSLQQLHALLTHYVQLLQSVLIM